MSPKAPGPQLSKIGIDVDDDAKTVAAKLRAHYAKIIGEQLMGAETQLSPLEYLRGRGIANWVDNVFANALARAEHGVSLAQALREACDAYLVDPDIPDREKEKLRNASDGSRERMFREWRKQVQRGAIIGKRFDTNNFGEAVFGRDYELAGRIFAGLSKQTRKWLVHSAASPRKIRMRASRF